MKQVNLEQHGKHWHDWRKAGFGGSDACAIMGTTTWTTRDQLISEKAGTAEAKDFENARMARGKRLEPIARKVYEDLTGRLMPPICVEHDSIPWLRASLDGWNDRDRIVLEIKCMSDHAHAKALAGKYTPYYKPQLFHQLLVCDTARAVHFWSFTDSEAFAPHKRYALVPILRDGPGVEEYLCELFLQEKETYESVQAMKRPH